MVGRDVVRRELRSVSLLHGRSLPHQHLHHFRVPSLGGVVQGGVARLVGRDDVRAWAERTHIRGWKTIGGGETTREVSTL